MLNAVLDEMILALRSAEPVVLAGFGTFAVVQRKACDGRNPQSGATLSMAASNRVHFRASQALKDAVRQ